MKQNIIKKNKKTTATNKNAFKGKIAIVAWNDSVVNPKNLSTVVGKFQKGGPNLRIEFSRISTSGHLTPVLDAKAPATETFFAVAKGNNLKKVAAELAKREGITKNMDRIGFVSLKDMAANNRSMQKHPDVCTAIADWAQKKGFSAVVWQELGKRFKNKIKIAFNNQNALNYLEGLNKKNRERAIRYIQLCPVETPFKEFAVDEML